MRHRALPPPHMRGYRREKTPAELRRETIELVVYLGYFCVIMSAPLWALWLLSYLMR